MNLNYVGSVAERFMQFSSGVFASEGVSEEVFNSLVIYLPSSLAADNLIDVNVFGVTDKPVALTVNVENYRDKLKGALLAQWEPIFRQDTNYDVTLVVVVFFVPSAALIPEATTSSAALRAIANTAQGILTSAENDVSDATSALGTANADLVIAQDTYDSAEEALAVDPDDPDLQAAFTAAEEALEGAQEDVVIAQTALDDAVVVRDEALEDFNMKDGAAGVEEEFVELSAGSYLDFLTVSETAIDYSYLTSAVEKTYFAGYFKFLFSKNYNGKNVTGYDERWLFDLSLCLAYLGKVYRSLSSVVLFAHLNVPVNGVDTNRCLALSATPEQEALVTSFNGSVAGFTDPRNQLFAGMLQFMEADNTWFIIHSENIYVPSRIFSVAMSERNETGTFVGNKLAKIRLTGNGIKPTGVPSIFDSSVNENLSKVYAENLDAKNISYLLSIADDSANDAMIVRAKGMTGYPVIATEMSKWIDYTTSIEMAKLIANQSTLINPVLRNERTYSRIQERLLANIQTFARIGRITNIILNFPPYSELPASKTDISVTAGWEATYVDDLEKVVMTGSIVV